MKNNYQLATSYASAPINEKNSYTNKLKRNQLLSRLELIIRMLNFTCRNKITAKPELKKIQLDSIKIQNTLQSNFSLTIKELEDMVVTCESYLSKCT